MTTVSPVVKAQLKPSEVSPFVPAYSQTTERLEEFQELAQPEGLAVASQSIDNFVQPVKTLACISVTLLGITTVERAVIFAKAFASMHTTLFGIVTDEMVVLSENALAAIQFTVIPSIVEGIVNVTEDPSYPRTLTVVPSIDIHLIPSAVVPVSIPYPQTTGREEEFQVEVQELGCSSI